MVSTSLKNITKTRAAIAPWMIYHILLWLGIFGLTITLFKFNSNWSVLPIAIYGVSVLYILVKLNDNIKDPILKTMPVILGNNEYEVLYKSGFFLNIITGIFIIGKGWRIYKVRLITLDTNHWIITKGELKSDRKLYYLGGNWSISPEKYSPIDEKTIEEDINKLLK